MQKLKTTALKTTALVGLLAATVCTAIAQSKSPACNKALITGVYGFTIEGTKLGGNGPVGPQFGVAMTEFDGKGGLQQIDSVTVNGAQNPNAGSFTEPGGPTSGTYYVNADCTGGFTLDFTDGRPTVITNFVIVNDGNEIDTVVLGPVGPDGNPVPGVLSVQSIGKRRFTPLGFPWTVRGAHEPQR